MNVKDLAAAILALATGILYGDIYDTTAELDKKYGEAVEVDGHTRIYHWKDYRVECTLFQFRPELLLAQGMSPQEEPNCIGERITRLDGKRLTMVDLRTVLPTQIDGGEWTQMADNKWRTRFAKARTSSKDREIIVRTSNTE